jgi:hypothetical protein
MMLALAATVPWTFDSSQLRHTSPRAGARHPPSIHLQADLSADEFIALLKSWASSEPAL